MQPEDKKMFLKIVKFFIDLISINLALFISGTIFFDWSLETYFNNYSELIFISSVLIISLVSAFKLYALDKKLEKRDLLNSLAAVLIIFSVLISFFNLIVPSYNYSWSFLFLFYLFSAVFIISARLVIFRREQKISVSKNIAVVGGSEEVKKLISRIQSKSDEYNLKTVIVNKHNKDLEQQIIDAADIYFGFKWLEPTVDRLENIDVLIVAYNNLEDKIKARLFNLKSSPGTRIYILPAVYDPNFFDPDLTR